jgi:hypothetical protein
VKRLLAGVILALVLVSCACGQTVLYRTSATLEWDAVTLDTTGGVLLPGDTIAYEVYIYAGALVDPQDVAALTLVGTTSTLSQLITFPRRATWIAGVRVRLVDGGGNLSYSTIAWSDVIEDAGADGPFVYSPRGLPKRPGALRDSGT